MRTEHRRKLMAAVAARQGGRCAICMAKGWDDAPITELHHARIHDTRPARKRYPLFVDSIFNVLGVSHGAHMAFPSFGKWPERRVALIERGLQRHPKHQKWVLCAKTTSS